MPAETHTPERRVLIALDDSPYAELIVREVVSHPWPPNTDLRVMSATGVHPGDPLPMTPTPHGGVSQSNAWPVASLETRSHLLEAARQVAERGVSAIRASGLHAVSRIREGTPATSIVEEAREWPADLIVLGTRGRGALARLIMGSVASYVLHHAPCSVYVVRARESV